MSVKNVETVKFSDLTSTEIYLDRKVLSAIQVPDDAAFDNKILTLYAQGNDNNFAPVYDREGNVYTIACGALRYIPLDLQDMVGAGRIKFLSDITLDGKEMDVIITDIIG